MKQISDNEIYLLIKYIKSVLWRAVKRLSYIQNARCLKVKVAKLCDDFLLQTHAVESFMNYLFGLSCTDMLDIYRMFQQE